VKEERKKHFLLYYKCGDSNDSRDEADISVPFCKVTYCTSIDFLSEAQARTVAEKPGVRFLFGETGSIICASPDCFDEWEYEPPYEVRTRESMSEELWNKCCGAMNCFDEENKSSIPIKEVGFMREIALHAERIRKPSRLPVLRSCEPVVMGKPTNTRRGRDKKYEAPVEEYIVNLREAVLDGSVPSARVANLTSMDIAEHIIKQEGFKNNLITSIEQKVRKTVAWKKRHETLKAVYETGTFINRLNTNSPYQEV
jgi:hypothetical protein